MSLQTKNTKLEYSNLQLNDLAPLKAQYQIPPLVQIYTYHGSGV